MSAEINHSDQVHDDGLAVEIVNILQSNTRLNYDVCAFNLIEIFKHMSAKLPNFKPNSDNLIRSIEQSICDRESNMDLNILSEHLKFLTNLNKDLQSGEKNFYECNDQIENSLNVAIKLLSNQINFSIFTSVLVENRDTLLSLFEIWQLSTNKTLKNLIVEYFYWNFYSDKFSVHLLYENANLAAELCCSIRQNMTVSDPVSIGKSLICLTLMIENNKKLSSLFLEFLKSSDILSYFLTVVESESELLYKKVNFKNVTLRGSKSNDESHEYFFVTLSDLFLHFFLSLNKKFDLPEENLLVGELLKSEYKLNKFLSEKLIHLLNLETDPLNSYAIKDDSNLNSNNMDNLYLSSVLKFISDLFSTQLTSDTTGIFYLTDFNVLVDIIIRKLSNLSAIDQIRVDYLSLVHLIIKNSNYSKTLYRWDDILECFNSILNEKDQDTVDQDIIRIILKENPELLSL